jgi:alkaline phosphatase D
VGRRSQVARTRLLDTILASGARNPFAMTGDWHSTFVNEIRYDPTDPASPTVLPEIVTPAIASNGDGPVNGPYYGPMIPFNPHIRYFVRFVDRVGAPEGGIATAASFAVEDGDPVIRQTA